jgi:hypothetical protein
LPYIRCHIFVAIYSLPYIPPILASVISSFSLSVSVCVLCFQSHYFFPPVEIQCVYCMIGTEFVNTILHFMLQRVTASRLRQTRSIQYISLQSHSAPCNCVPFPCATRYYHTPVTTDYSNQLPCIISSTRSVCPSYC